MLDDKNNNCSYKPQCAITPSGVYLLKIISGHTRTRCEMCSELTTKTQ